MDKTRSKVKKAIGSTSIRPENYLRPTRLLIVDFEVRLRKDEGEGERGEKVMGRKWA